MFLDIKVFFEKDHDYKLVLQDSKLDCSWLDTTDTNRYLNLVWFTEPYNNLIKNLRFDLTNERLRYGLRAWK